MEHLLPGLLRVRNFGPGAERSHSDASRSSDATRAMREPPSTSAAPAERVPRRLTRRDRETLPTASRPNPEEEEANPPGAHPHTSRRMSMRGSSRDCPKRVPDLRSVSRPAHTLPCTPNSRPGFIGLASSRCQLEGASGPGRGEPTECWPVEVLPPAIAEIGGRQPLISGPPNMRMCRVAIRTAAGQATANTAVSRCVDTAEYGAVSPTLYRGLRRSAIFKPASGS
jgi:hypothetical protein